MINDFFDEVYVVSLPERQDRRDTIKCELEEQGINFVFFDAIKHDNGVVGLVRSMIKLFTEALEKKQKNILVLEDDTTFLFSALPFLKETLPQLPQDYLTFHLGLNLLTHPERISNNILRVNQSYSTHSIAYSEEAMRLILDYIKPHETLAYDIFIRDHIQPFRKSYCTIPMLCTQRTGFSDIEGKEIDWAKLMSMTFAMHTKKLQAMPNEIAYCNNGHMINWQQPTINPNLHQIQHPELIGQVCDCKRFIYKGEDLCGCAIKEWRITWEDNPNR